MGQRGAGYKDGERYEVTIERIVPGGAGLARGPHGVVFIELAAPGDVLEIEIETVRGGVAYGRIISIIEPGTDRVDAPCAFYGVCGGCDFQHLRYEAQLDAKEAIVRDALARIGKITWSGPIERFAARQPFGTRARVELHTGVAAGVIGFNERHSRQVVDIDHCLVSEVEINRAISEIRSLDRPLPEAIHLITGGGITRSSPAIGSIRGEPFWLEIGSFDYVIDPGDFFQSSLDLLPSMIDRVLGSIGVNLDIAWDLFCGAGLFSLPLAQHFHQVIGVELSRNAVRHAIAGAERNQITNTKFVAADVRHWMARERRSSAAPDLVVVDPPRSGLGDAIARFLVAKQIDRLVYVSCDPTTLARDLRMLTGGDLEIVDIAIFDLFPQTHHVETIVRLATR